MNTRWTAEVSEDLQSFATLLAYQAVEEEAFQQRVDQTEGETDGWYEDGWDEDWVVEEPQTVVERRTPTLFGRGMGSWPALKTVVVEWLQRWPSNAPILR